MHLIVREANEAFEPEGGAYGGHGAHGHHGHSHDDHAHEHSHGGDSAAPVGPVLHPDAYGGGHGHSH
jgi:urease accessory protein